MSFRTSADDLFPLFDRYGKVVDIFIPRDRRSGDSRGFAFVRYKHADEAQKAIERLDGKNVDGRNIAVQFAKYGRGMETIRKGRITEENIKWNRSWSRSPKQPSGRYWDDYRENEYHRGSRSSSKHDQDRFHEQDKDYRRRSFSCSRSRSRSHSRSQISDADRRHTCSITPDRRASPSKNRGSISPAGRKLCPKDYSHNHRNRRSRSATPESHSQSASQNVDAGDCDLKEQ